MFPFTTQYFYIRNWMKIKI